MIIEVIPKAYDADGKRTFYPRKKRFRGFAPNSPMGRHITQPLSLQCESIEDIHKFLRKCRYMSDQEQFGVKDYWMPPEEFEKKCQGDCDDFALWV
jgi:predicted transglutaminase-like cysteine proteinase